jgi:hypothetical protein
MNTTEITDHYKLPHYIVLNLEQTADAYGGVYRASILNTHRKYYAKLALKNKVISYGNAMNMGAICIVLSVSSDQEFMEIIDNDPAIDWGILKVSAVTPFIDESRYVFDEYATTLAEQQ